MDPNFNGGGHDTNDFLSFEDEIVYPSFAEPPSLLNDFQYKENTLDVNFNGTPFSPPLLYPPNTLPFSSMGSEVEPPDAFDSDSVFKYLNEILFEENMDERLYCSTSVCTTSTSSVDPNGVFDPWGYYMPSIGQSDASDNAECSMNSNSNFGNRNSKMDGHMYGNLLQNTFNDSDSMLQVRKGTEEASKFLPAGNQLIIDLDKYNLPPTFNEILSNPDIKLLETDESNDSFSGSSKRKHLQRPESDLEEPRSSKQFAGYVEGEVELSEMFDRVLLFTDAGVNPVSQAVEADKTKGHNKVKRGSAIRKNRPRNQGNKSEAFDLRSLVNSCAQSVAADDRRTAYEQLKLIRQHSSSTGDVNQRLANIFANGLEARLAGIGSEIYYASLKSKPISAVEKLRAYHVYLLACPFKNISMCFANKMILHSASKGTTLHIVDFGILYGFQWPILIQNLSNIPGGPPKLRITGIEHPQTGFKPAELVEETGRRLARYCERFHVPFEYRAIVTQNWETIKLDELKIVKGEVLAVNSLFRFKNLLDETVLEDNPRDGVLKLIRQMNPAIVVTNIVSGSYNAPFFVTRLHEVLYHYTSLFDMLDATLSLEDEHRLNFEVEFYGREVMNVLSCEGPARVERPDTYKQWHVRHKRAGFNPLPLSRELVTQLRCKVKAGYHKDFVLDEDNSWIMQGWKGRIACACSSWVPA